MVDETPLDILLSIRAEVTAATVGLQHMKESQEKRDGVVNGQFRDIKKAMNDNYTALNNKITTTNTEVGKLTRRADKWKYGIAGVIGLGAIGSAFVELWNFIRGVTA